MDESFIIATPDGPRSRDGNVGAPVDPRETTRVCEFNDIAALERELAHGDVAAVLMEPALTNIGIVLPEPGYLAAVRALTREHGTLLINDETHTFSAGPGGCTKAWGLEPDIVTIGKSIAGGIPAGAYGLAPELAERILADKSADIEDTGGVGGTLAGNALSVTAMRATLEHVLTDAAFDRMISVADRYTAGVREVMTSFGLPLEHRAARRPGRVPVLPGAAAHRRRVGRRRRHRARRVPAPVPGQPRDPADPVPQHGADVPGDHRGGRRRAHPGVHAGMRRAGGLAAALTPRLSAPSARARS